MHRSIQMIMIALTLCPLSACGEKSKGFIASNPESDKQSHLESASKVNSSFAPETISRDDVAYEPVAVGGAYLVCAYQEDQSLDALEWNLTCKLDGVKNLGPAIRVIADFKKVTATGEMVSIATQVNDNSSLVWQISEKAGTVKYGQVLAKISIGDQAPLSFKTDIKPSSLKLTADVWFLNEPSNKIRGTDTDEDCMEAGNLAERLAYEPNAPATSQRRFNDRECAVSQAFLCRNVSSASGAEWIISTKTGPFSIGLNADTCPAGFRFGFPYTAAELVSVGKLLDAAAAARTRLTIWVAASDLDKDNKFKIVQK